MTAGEARPISIVDLSVFGRKVLLAGFEDEYIFTRVSSTRQFYEVDLLNALASLELAEDSLIIDVGANLGNHTLFLSQAFSNPILAIEPAQSNLLLLERNVTQNQLEGRVEVLPVALWDAESTVSLANSDLSNMGMFHASEDPLGDVQATTLDIVAAGRPVALVKIDVEGAESRVLSGGVTTFERHHPVLVTEVHSAKVYRDVAAVLIPLGYQVVGIAGRSDNYVWAHDRGPGWASVGDLRARLGIESQRRLAQLIGGRFDTVVHAVREGNRVAATSEGVEEHFRALAKAIVDSDRGVAKGLDSVLAAIVSARNAILPSVEPIAGLESRLAESLSAALADSDRVVTDALHVALEEVASVKGQILPALEPLIGLEERLRADQGERDAVELAKITARCEALQVDIATWAGAYRDLSERFSKIAPLAWDHRVAGATLQKVMRSGVPEAVAESWVPSSDSDAGGVRELVNPAWRRTDRVRVGIASMPGREEGLRVVLKSLVPQADEIFVYLNGFDHVPAELAIDERVRFFTGPDHGDRAKFMFMEGYAGYYLTCDDDIAYPDFYVDHIVDGIERYGRRAVVGWHGSVFKDGFSDYYDPASRRVVAYYSNRSEDLPVHLLGTGIAGFHTSTLLLSLADFEVPNMADVWLALKAREQGVPMVVLRHERGWADPLDRGAPSISNASIKQDGGKRLDMRQVVSRTVRDNAPWTINEPELVWERPTLRLAMVGRTDVARWRKGGILKSSHLTAAALRRFGVDVVLEDIETGDPAGLSGATPDIVMIYVGDPERPDFASVEELVGLHASRGRVVVINMSVEGTRRRSDLIVEKMREWDAAYPGLIRLMVFTNAAIHLAGLERISDLLVTIPKTIVLPPTPHGDFHASSGIFVGDVAKLSDESLIGGPAREWISAIRSAVPEARLIGVEQYRPRYDVDLGLDEVWPYLSDEFSASIARARLMVSVIARATYEMVPVEVSSMGIPVLYRDMPQSLSETVGLAGVRIGDASELASTLPILYRDPTVWRSMSEAGRRRASSQDLRSSAGHMYLRLAALAARKSAL